MLLGHKTRIDKTIAVLLQHQMTTTQKIVFTIGQKYSTSRVPSTVLKFLRAVAKKEWKRFVNLVEGESCKRVLGSVSCWKIHCMNHTNVCDDIDWSCTHKSHHPPCRPIMYMDDVGHDFEVLPVIAIHYMWSM
ncbi:hypothetical protein JG688_00017095 [Phytophthora aleatoria]|uniref:Uncharacterized protein n=1 Tax=Phytophthora aleatoria TaxID=2496075 RepID=A0A8J5IT31_9STRA|nr:hypothetical protein JG688_00017095 [Phytophthora aleatoria]